MKKKLGIVILLAVIAAGCFFVGQYNVKKSLFALSEDFAKTKVEDNGVSLLSLHPGDEIEGSLKLGSSYVTLTFDYEVKLPDGEQLSSDANLEINVTCPDIPDGRILWAFEPGKMETSGSMNVDLKAFKGKNINMKFTCKGSLPKGGKVRVKNIYVSKMYAGS